MKIAIVTTVLLGLAWSLPEDLSHLKFKRLYVDPIKPLPKNLLPRITNGQEATPHSIPYQVYLIATGQDGSWLCGGSLISRKFVLTAGHCVYGGIDATVYLGAHKLETEESTLVEVTSRTFICHENYDADSISNDIGLIELSEEVELNEYINVVALTSQAGDTYEGDSARISGWGLTSGNADLSDVLLEVNATVISNQECNSIYGIVLDSQICTSGEGGVGSCDGDSGGPLVYNNKLIGVVSYGEATCSPGYPSGFTRVTSYLDWIAQHSDVTF